MVIEQHNLLAKLIQDINEYGVFHPQFLIQGALLLICWSGAYWFSRSLLKQYHGQTVKWKVGEDGIRRVLFPVLALILVSFANLVLHLIEGRTNSLLRVANLLMLAMVNIRILVYLLRLAFDGSDWVKQSEKYIAGSIWVAYVLYVVGILPEVMEVLDSLSFNAGPIHISVLTVIQGLLSVGVTLLLAMWVGRLLEQRLMSASLMDMNVRVVLVKVMRSLLIVLAVLASLAMVGIDLTVLSVFGGALGVGLGFGLQKIASNYVSGFIILLDRSVKLGDVIAVDNRQGVISKLTSRYVVLKAPDGTESLVPNETLITSTVVNNSYYERSIWIGLPVQIAYSSDLEMVMKLLPTVTLGNERILQDPAPGVMILAFADNGINLTLGFWLKDPENGQGGLRSDLYLKIWQLFKQHGIEIPYPRRDITILPSPAAQHSVS
ncbi:MULTISPECIES: mechanosensitive ion channel family protein [Deefgea]|uniref:Mechanosensitive ion channel n=1 Tax=Deefgea chitinilytica TaxID=570276 RepID=A0ABS2CFF6_9NEIS|nr:MULTISPECIES: mechanosensitive ion channel domain-containing protein [Deefgea]MBM5572867.1 mechanosensitive ion channel [Deefgea chitinilytica]MBM9890104.1 mechanosensitive ion channel [Deefgea sp. CFH1-16]